MMTITTETCGWLGEKKNFIFHIYSVYTYLPMYHMYIKQYIHAHTIITLHIEYTCVQAIYRRFIALKVYDLCNSSVRHNI